MSGVFKGILKRLFRTFMGYGAFWLLIVLFFVFIASGVISPQLFNKFLSNDSALGRLTGSLTDELTQQVKSEEISSPASVALTNDILPEKSLDTPFKDEGRTDSPLTEQYYIYQEGEYTSSPVEIIEK